MGMFKNKPDPFSKRAKELQRQIAELEGEIQRLNAAKPGLEPPSSPPPASPSPPPSPSAIPPIGGAEPRLRSTAHPQGPTVVNPPNPFPPSSPRPSVEPIFEEVQQNPFRASHGAPKEKDQALGIRQDDFSSFWQRLKNHFRGPVASNPKLVNYLAAGSIQGLRPLRYERRIARNRFIVLVVILVLILWGILALLLKH